jgi:Na+/proline symporter
LTAIALNIALGFDMLTCILVTSGATAIYSCAGGVRSVVWNDCIQFGVYMLGAFGAAYLLLTQIPGGWERLVEFGSTTGRWQLFDFSFALNAPTMTFWSGFLGGAFLSLATHGVDQLIVQRYLCARSKAAAAWALGLSGFVVLAQFAVFLFIGVQLACYNEATGGIGEKVSGDEAFMTYVVNHMNSAMKGLILAAILAAAMSTLASSFNSSASSLLSDWLARLMPPMSDRKALNVSRGLTLFFALTQCVVAMAAWYFALEKEKAIVDAVLTIAGFAIGLLLGLYALGLIAPRTPEPFAIAAFGVATVVTTVTAFATPLNTYWYTIVGSGTTVCVGLLLGAIFGQPMNKSSEGDV